MLPSGETCVDQKMVVDLHCGTGRKNTSNHLMWWPLQARKKNERTTAFNPVKIGRLDSPEVQQQVLHLRNPSHE